MQKEVLICRYIITIEKQIMRRFLLILLIVWGYTTVSVWADKQIFVSPKGNDRAMGTLSHPLKSIQAALEKAKALEHENVQIILREGIYEQSKTLEIDDKGKYASLTIRPYKNESVSISGGKKIPLSAIKKISNKKLSHDFQKMYVNKFRKSTSINSIFLLPIYTLPVSDVQAALPGANFLLMIFLLTYHVGLMIQPC